MGFLADDISINTVLGNGSFFKNEVRVQGNVRIQGDVDGNIDATGNVFIGEKARIRGNINAASVEIFGILLGDIHAPQHVKIFSPAAVIGDVFTKRIQIEEKAVFQGHCISHRDDDKFEKSKIRFVTEKSILSSKIGNESKDSTGGQ